MSDSNNVTVTFVIFTAVVIIYIIWYFMCTTFFLFWDQCPSAFGFPPWAHYTPFVIFQTCIVRCHTVVHFYSRRRQNNAVFPSGIPSPGPLIFPGLNTHTTPMSATPQVCHLSWQLTASSLPCVPSRKLKWRFCWSKKACGGVTSFGRLPILLSSVQFSETDAERRDIFFCTEIPV